MMTITFPEVTHRGPDFVLALHGMDPPSGANVVTYMESDGEWLELFLKDMLIAKLARDKTTPTFAVVTDILRYIKGSYDDMAAVQKLLPLADYPSCDIAIIREFDDEREFYGLGAARAVQTLADGSRNRFGGEMPLSSGDLSGCGLIYASIAREKRED